MAGRINEEDIALVRERARIEDVVGQHIQLRNAGGGSLKGLCPFHDEKTPSFQVTPARGLFYCFGCGEGGDVITFEQKINNLTFSEAVQALADQTGVQLRIVDDGAPAQEPGLRVQIFNANQAALDFYTGQITSPEAIVFRQFLAGRGFDRAAAEHFQMGYAPKDGRALHRHLNARGFSDKVLVRAGLIRENGWDFFQGRVLWPIRDSAKSVLGFGARRVFDDDRMPAKYVNTPETPVYKKSHVLYGLELARQSIGKQAKAVIVEGYTDVMACHLAGEDTAVASCGTAFGADHARLIARLMGNNAHGEVIFTFDGDAAGQKAAMKVFDLDQTFTSQTYVAVEPTGLDPCDVRLQRGDVGVRDLIGRRVPLYHFVMSNTVNQFDLDRVDGRLAAVRAAAPLLSSVRDAALVSSYVRELSQMVGMDIDEVRKIVSQTNRRQVPAEVKDNRQTAAMPEAKPNEPTLGGLSLPWPDPNDRTLGVERGTLKLMLQHPTLFDTAWDGVEADDFTHPTYRALAQAIFDTPFQPEGWAEEVSEQMDDETLLQLQIALLVEPLLREPTEDYASMYAARLRLMTTQRRLGDLRSKLQRMNPVTHEAEHKRLFSQLLELETQRRQLEQEVIGFES